MFKGLKPHVVEVTPKGRIDGACKGKNAWDALIKSMAPRTLDVSIVHVKDQDLAYMATLEVRMDGLYEYLNNPLCQKGFEDSICRFLKGKRYCFKHIFTHKAQWTCPIGIKPIQWDQLIRYWIDEKTIIKAFHMSNAQGNQKKTNKYG